MNAQNWTSRIDEITRAFLEKFGDLDVRQLNWKPADEVWSIAQNIDHIITINNTYPPVIQAIRADQYHPPFTSKIGFLVRFFGKMILDSVQPDRSKKTKTFPIWEPSSSKLSADILERFVQHQEELKMMILESDDLLAKGTIISSPANKYLVYRLDTAFEIIVTHEGRHFAQAQEVLAEMKKEVI